MSCVFHVCCQQDESGAPIAGPEFSAELAAELDQYGAPMGAVGQWASCVRLVDPAGVNTQQNLAYHSYQALFAPCACTKNIQHAVHWAKELTPVPHPTFSSEHSVLSVTPQPLALPASPMVVLATHCLLLCVPAVCLPVCHPPPPPELSTKCVLELDGNEGICSMALVRFEGTGLPDNSLLLAVGTAEQMTYFPTSCTAGYIRLYK